MKDNTVIHKTLYVEPTSKARARVVRRGNKTMSFTPAKTAHAQNQIRDLMMDITHCFARDVPLKLKATFYRLRPKSTKKDVEYPVTRPDLDNYTKLLTDAMESFIYQDDAQITTAIISKRFGTPPRIEIILMEDTE